MRMSWGGAVRLSLGLSIVLAIFPPSNLAQAQTNTCNPALPAGCHMELSDHDNESTLRNGGDVHTWLFTMPAPGEIAVVLSYCCSSNIDLDAYLVGSDGQIIVQADRNSDDYAANNAQESVIGRLEQPGEYRAYVQINPSRDRSQNNVKYRLTLWPLPGIGNAFDWDSGANWKTIGWHSDKISQVEVSSSGQLLTTVGRDWFVGVWSVPDGREMMFHRTNLEVRSALVLPGDTYLVIGLSPVYVNRPRPSIEIYDITTGQLVQTLLRDVTVNHLAVSPDGNYFLAALDTARTLVWRVSDLSLVADLRQQTQGINSAAFSPDGQEIVTVSRSRISTIWNVASGTIRTSFDVGKTPNDVAVSPDGTWLAIAHDAAYVSMWNMSDGTLFRSLAHDDPGRNVCWSVAISSDGTRIASASTTDLRIWNSQDGGLTASFDLHPSRLGGIAHGVRFLPGRDEVVAAIGNGRARLFRLGSS